MAKKMTKYKMQEVSFQSVEDFLEYLPDDELQIVIVLRALLFQCFPELNEKLSFNVPFYKRHKGIFFIWPASILWGKTKSYSGVRLGFMRGYLLTNEDGYLNQGDRKQVSYRDFESVDQIDVDLLKSYLFEAAVVDDHLVKAKK